MAKQGKKKVGRNDPCPCGSGLKYKRCHGKLSVKPVGPTPAQIKAMLESHKAKELRRQDQQGKGKPIISTEFQGYRFTAVGNKLHYAKSHKTFIDFLGDYIKDVLDPEWGNSEITKPLEERHQILQWYNSLCLLHKDCSKITKGELKGVPINGLTSAYYGLAYNLYLLQHNAELQAYLIGRLKQAGSFYAAYYETFVAAWFILAGFKIRLENEQDSSRSHPEFIATRDGQSYSVEAKTREPGKKHFDVGNQLYKGLCIDSDHPRVILIDMNVGADADSEALANEVLSAIKGREEKLTIQSEPAPPAHVFVTNQPYHLALSETQFSRIYLAAGFKIPDFGHGVKFSSYTEAYKVRKKYSALRDVQDAMINYRIPITFDGEIVEFSTGEAERRFNFGERLELSDGVFMILQSGIVIESEKKACLIANDDNGQSHILVTKLSDSEMAAYRSHPETFFGRVINIPKNTDDPMDLYEFFINSYKMTPRDKLIEHMKGALDVSKLEKLPDDELLYTYADGMTHSVIQKRKE